MKGEKSPSPTELSLYGRPEGKFGEDSKDKVIKWREQIDHRLERMAKILEEGVTTKSIGKAARSLKVTPDVIRAWLREPAVLRQAAQYGTALGLHAQIRKAEEGDNSSFQALAKIAGVMESGGPKIQVNTAVDARTVGDTNSDRKFFEQYRQRVENRVEQPAPSD